MERDIDGLVFAGGGSRCFWQLGFLEVVEPALGSALSPRAVIGVSAGSAMACCWRAGRTRSTLEGFMRAAAENPRNFYPDRLLARQPAFPHLTMYRGALLDALDAEAMQRIATGPPLLVLIARSPRWLPARLSVLVGMGAYAIEKRIDEPVHPRAGRTLGFTAEVVDARECSSPRSLADAILHSSCTPPFTPLFVREGRPVLDGGLVDVAPVSLLPGTVRRPLVMLTRPYRRGLPKDEGTGPIYVAPSRAVPVGKWDYTSPEKLRATFDLGRRDGEEFLRQDRHRRAA